MYYHYYYYYFYYYYDYHNYYIIIIIIIIIIQSDRISYISRRWIHAVRYRDIYKEPLLKERYVNYTNM